MKKYFFIFMLTILTIPVFAQTTIKIVIRPVSINDKDSVLCRTSMEENPDGDFFPELVKYGWLILNQNGTSEEFPDTFIKLDDETDLERLTNDYQHFQLRFESDINWQSPTDSLMPVIRKYNFKQNNASSFCMTLDMTTEDFIKQYRLASLTQTTVGDKKSVKNNSLLRIVFDYKNIIILENRADYSVDTSEINPMGSEFDFAVGKTDISQGKPYVVNRIRGFLIRNFYKY